MVTQAPIRPVASCRAALIGAALTGACVVAWVSAGCEILDTNGKRACDVDHDCLGGWTCVAQRCVFGATLADARGGDGGGDAPARDAHGRVDHDRCLWAEVVDLASGTAFVEGDTRAAGNEFEARLVCEAEPMIGRQVYYRVELPDGVGLKMTMRSTFRSQLVVIPSSSNCEPAMMGRACSSQGREGGVYFTGQGGIGRHFFWPVAGGEYLIAVDSTEDGPAGTGGFSLELERVRMAPHARCARAKPVAFVSDLATISDDTGFASNEFGDALRCGGEYPLIGPQLYYQIEVPAGRGLAIDLRQAPSTQLALFRKGAGCQPAAVEADCSSGGATGDIARHRSGAEQHVFWPATAGTYVLAVDASGWSDSRSFILQLELVKPQPHSRCLSPQPVTLVADKATINGNTRAAANEFGSQIVCAGLPALAGPQLYYRLALQHGVRVAFTADFDARLALFRQSSGCDPAKIVADCSSGGLTGEVLTAGLGEQQFSSPGEYLLAVEGMTSADVGAFSLRLEAYDPPANRRCSGAEHVVVGGANKNGMGLISGHRADGENEFGQLLKCGSTGTVVSGPKLYYSVDLGPGQTLRLRNVQRRSWAHVAIFPDSANCQPAGISQACGSNGAQGEWFFGFGCRDTGYFRPSVPGRYVLAVNEQRGRFGIELAALAAPAHGNCSKAQQISLTNGQAKIYGDTSAASDEFSNLKCGAAGTLAGPQVYYRLALSSAKSYRINLEAAFAATIYVVPAATGCSAAAIAGACRSPTGGVATVPAEQTNDLWFTPPVSGDYLLAVDSASTTDSGPFVVAVAESPSAAPVLQAPLALDFETTCGALRGSRDWECGSYQWLDRPLCCGADPPLPPPAAHSGAAMWGTRLAGCSSDLQNNDGSLLCTNNDVSDDSVLEFRAALPANWSQAELTFWSWEDIGTAYAGEVRIDGTRVAAYCATPYPPATAWQKRTIDLSLHVGKTVAVSFHYVSLAASASGWYIDDVAVSGS